MKIINTIICYLFLKFWFSNKKKTIQQMFFSRFFTHTTHSSRLRNTHILLSTEKEKSPDDVDTYVIASSYIATYEILFFPSKMRERGRKIHDSILPRKENIKAYLSLFQAHIHFITWTRIGRAYEEKSKRKLKTTTVENK